MPRRIIFATGNNEKFHIAQAVCKPYAVELVQKSADIDEIQSEVPETIIHKKAQQAFQKFGEPVVVSDDSWAIPALHGFPGPYMKSVNHWLSTSDWLTIMKPYKDRSIVLIQLLAYQDAHEYQCFRSELKGYFLHEARGTYGSPVHKTITMTGDRGLSIAEVYDRGIEHDKRENTSDWVKLLQWHAGKRKVAP